MAGVFSKKLIHSALPNQWNKVAIIHHRPLPVIVRLRSSEASGQTQYDKRLLEDEYQYLHKSQLPTMHFQNSLLRLPIPVLEHSCKRYLAAQEPLLEANAYERTKDAVSEFLRNEGPECQKSLIQQNRKNKHTSYISKPWFEKYLKDRTPIPINVNPILVFVNDPVKEMNKQSIRATNLVISSLRFYKSLSDNVLEPEVYHMDAKKSNTQWFRTVMSVLPKFARCYAAYMFQAYPLDMSQYPNLFNTTRVPELEVDRIKHVEGKKHITVMKGGHFYVLDVLDKDGKIFSPEVILTNIKAILQSKSNAAHPVGLMTTENRDTWAMGRSYLESLGNSEALELIDSSLFNLVLDDDHPGEDPVKIVRQFLHGDGTNRWFDKSFSIIVAKDGTAGINFEHSWGDGVAVLRFFNDIYKDSTTKPRVNSSTQTSGDVTARKLIFNLDDRMKKMINDAQQHYERLYRPLEVRVLDYPSYGRELCKPIGVSPDAMMQMCFQIAYHKMTGKQASTYESGSTAGFKHGRTETVRPCTMATKKLCEALALTLPPGRPEILDMVIECSKVHTKLIKEAAFGQGFDRHLFALQLQAEAKGLRPAIFKDRAYHLLNYPIMSTSTLNSEYLLLGAFGPVNEDCFGIGYSVWDKRLGCIVTNRAGCSDGAAFFEALRNAFLTMSQILSYGAVHVSWKRN